MHVGTNESVLQILVQKLEGGLLSNTWVALYFTVAEAATPTWSHWLLSTLPAPTTTAFCTPSVAIADASSELCTTFIHSTTGNGYPL